MVKRKSPTIVTSTDIEKVTASLVNLIKHRIKHLNQLLRRLK